MANRQRQRILSRANIHTIQEAEQTRNAIIAELQPLTSLVSGGSADSREERIKARNNQIALLQAANREDREAIRKERVATREANAVAKAAAKAKASDDARIAEEAAKMAAEEAPRATAYAPFPEIEEPEIRAAEIKQNEIKTHGGTPGCPGRKLS